jgi:hypothetical protein
MCCSKFSGRLKSAISPCTNTSDSKLGSISGSFTTTNLFAGDDDGDDEYGGDLEGEAEQ